MTRNILLFFAFLVVLATACTDDSRAVVTESPRQCVAGEEPLRVLTTELVAEATFTTCNQLVFKQSNPQGGDDWWIGSGDQGEPEKLASGVSNARLVAGNEALAWRVVEGDLVHFHLLPLNGAPERVISLPVPGLVRRWNFAGSLDNGVLFVVVDGVLMRQVGEELVPVLDFGAALPSTTVSPQLPLVALQTTDRTLMVDLDSGNLVIDAAQESLQPHTISFSPDGRYLIDDRTFGDGLDHCLGCRELINIFRVDTGELLTRSEAVASPIVTSMANGDLILETPDVILVRPDGQTETLGIATVILPEANFVAYESRDNPFKWTFLETSTGTHEYYDLRALADDPDLDPWGIDALGATDGDDVSIAIQSGDTVIIWRKAREPRVLRDSRVRRLWWVDPRGAVVISDRDTDQTLMLDEDGTRVDAWSHVQWLAGLDREVVMLVGREPQERMLVTASPTKGIVATRPMPDALTGSVMVGPENQLLAILGRRGVGLMMGSGQ